MFYAGQGCTSFTKMNRLVKNKGRYPKLFPAIFHKQQRGNIWEREVFVQKTLLVADRQNGIDIEQKVPRIWLRFDNGGIDIESGGTRISRCPRLVSEAPPLVPIDQRTDLVVASSSLNHPVPTQASNDVAAKRACPRNRPILEVPARRT